MGGSSSKPKKPVKKAALPDYVLNATVVAEPEPEAKPEPPPFGSPVGVSMAVIRKFCELFRDKDLESKTCEEVYTSVIEPQLGGKYVTFASRYIDVNDGNGAALTSDPTAVIAFGWSTSFKTLLSEIETFEATHPLSYYWLDLFDSTFNLSSKLPEEWWTHVFCDQFKRLDNGIIIGEYPWNGPEGKDIEEDITKYIHPLIGPLEKDKYATLPELLATEAEMPNNTLELNRYKNVLPTIKTMVVLPIIEGSSAMTEVSDYINANFIRGAEGDLRPPRYIGAQAPSKDTVDRFWRCAWEHRCPVIAMVTDWEEGEKSKCEPYLPTNERRVLKPSDLTLEKQEVVMEKDGFFRHSRIKVMGGWNDYVTNHLHFLGWPDRSVPKSTKQGVKFIERMRELRLERPRDCVMVHCSAGVGRTGVIICLDICIDLFLLGKQINIIDVLAQMRQDRGGMIQSDDQLEYSYKCLVRWVRNHTLASTIKQLNIDNATDTRAKLFDRPLPAPLPGDFIAAEPVVVAVVSEGDNAQPAASSSEPAPAAVDTAVVEEGGESFGFAVAN